MRLRKCYGCDHFWSPSYLIVSTGGAPLDIVREYVRKQGEEPRKLRNPNLTNDC